MSKEMDAALEVIIAARARAVLAPRENAIRQFMRGELAIKDWPLDDFHLAICADCGKMTSLVVDTGGKINPQVLEDVRGGKWYCDDCHDTGVPPWCEK